MATQRGTLPGTGDRDLDALFIGAEKWVEIETDESGHLAAIRVFVRHPQHTGCNALVEITPVATEDTGPGVRVSECETRRTITDNGRTPAAAIAQLARVTQRMVIELKRRGGPEKTPLADRLATVAGWLEVKGTMRKEVYASQQRVDARTLTRWEKELRDSGVLLVVSSYV